MTQHSTLTTQRSLSSMSDRWVCLTIRWQLIVISLALISSALISLTGCDDDPPPSSRTDEDATVAGEVTGGELSGGETTGGSITGGDITGGEIGDMELDLGAPEDMAWTFDLEVVEEEYSERAAPTDRLYAGYAERSLGFPVGIGTVGYFPPTGGFNNPYSNSGADTQHTSLTARVLLLRRGDQTVVLLRADMIALWQTFVVDIQRALRDRGRADLADGLIIGATHTHSSGGRIIDHPLLRLLAGNFLPALYNRFTSNFIEVILEADAAAQPARAGYDTVELSELHSDRRCENGDVIDHQLGLLKVTDDEGRLITVVVNYSMHGTAIAADEFLLSSDATGALERGIETHLPRHAPVLYFQSWAGDMSPRVPEEYLTEEGGETRDVYRDLSAIAQASADLLVPKIESIETRDDLELQVKTIRFPMSGELVNPGGTFDQYPHGGAYCYPTTSRNCPEDGSEQRVYDPSTLTCLLPVSEQDGITWGQIAAARIGELGLVTLPGEPLTSIGVELRDRALELTGLDQVWVIGYAQGYLGYLLHSYDYVLGGYEAAGGIWGPGLGEFLVERGVEIIAHVLDSDRPMSFRPVPLPERTEVSPESLTPEVALGEVEWVSPIARDERGVWSAEWIGGDPTVDSPLVTLEQALEAEDETQVWIPVTHASGLAWDSAGPEIETSLRVDPDFTEQPDRDGRRFYWRAQMPERFSVTPSLGQLSGRLRWVITGTRPEAYRLESAPFEITP